MKGFLYCLDKEMQEGGRFFALAYQLAQLAKITNALIVDIKGVR